MALSHAERRRRRNAHLSRCAAAPVDDVTGEALGCVIAVDRRHANDIGGPTATPVGPSAARVDGPHRARPRLPL
jgi:hypothetical protein